MHQYLFTITAHDLADRFHGGVAGTLAITWMGVVDMATPQTIRAVISMATTGDRRTNELLAVHAFERLIPFVSRRMANTILLFAGCITSFGELLSTRCVDLVICE